MSGMWLQREAGGYRRIAGRVKTCGGSLARASSAVHQLVDMRPIYQPLMPSALTIRDDG